MITQKVLEVLATFSKQPLADLQAKFKTETGDDLDEDTTATAFKEVLSSRLETFKDDTSKEVKRKTLTALEKELKQKFAIDASETGIDLISKIVDIETAKTKGTPATVDFSKWSESEWAKHEPFRVAAQNAASIYKDKATQLEAEFMQYKQKEATRQHEISVISALRAKLLSMNPNGLQNPATSEKLISDFLKSNFDFKKLKFDGEELVALDDDGEIQKGGKETLYQPVKAEDMLKTSWYHGFNSVPIQNNPPPPAGGIASSGLDSTLKSKIDACFKNNDKDGYFKLVKSLPSQQKQIAMNYWRDLSK